MNLSMSIDESAQFFQSLIFNRDLFKIELINFKYDGIDRNNIC